MADKGKGKGGKKGGNKKEKNKKPDSPVDSDTPQAAEPKLKALRSVDVQEGKKAILRCEALAGQPIANFKWYKNGKELSGKNKPKDVKIKNKKNKKSSELHFRKTTESNAGSYTCEAINDHGKDTAVGDLTVIKAVTSTTLSLRTSSHEKQCSEKDSSYCVNGGLCFTVEVTPGTNKLFCRCLPGYSGNRCQVTVPMKVMNRTQAEELYQKRVLTITGICIALLVVGIMCVVAYCKTKKQRKKLHDRLRQSLRTERHTMASMANGPQVFHPPRDNVQLVNQYVSKNSMSAEHIIEKETETSFSTSQCTLSAHHSTTITHTSSQSWSDGLGESVPSDCHSVLVRPSAENSKHATPSSRRERLNATGCSRDLSALNNSRNTPNSFKDSPYSEKYVSAMTTPNRMSPVEPISPLSPKSPKSPPSEMSPPLSSLTISVPSVAVSPQGEEERPLLFSTPPRLREKQRLDHGHSHSDQYQRNSAHYNHGQTHSPPPSPQRTAEEDEYETTQEYETAAPQPSKKLANGQRAKRTKPNDHVVQKLESNSDSSSESSSSESETEDERVGEDTPFLSIQNPLAASLESAPTFRPADSSRTNPGLRLSTQEDLQARLSNVMANQDPIAV